jgi:hypothetical protein
MSAINGATRLEKWNAIAGTHTVAYHPNLGSEQKLFDNFTARIGLDETSPTAGVTYRFSPFKLNIAYVRDLAKARVGDLFGTNSNGLLATLTFDFSKEAAPTKSAAAGGGELPAASALMSNARYLSARTVGDCLGSLHLPRGREIIPIHFRL